MSSYYDVDDILAEDQVCAFAFVSLPTNPVNNSDVICVQLMPVTFTIDAADLGYLDENSGGGKTVFCIYLEFLFNHLRTDFQHFEHFS
jgi:hypothetical protein